MHIIEIFLTIFASVMASSGLWSWLQNRSTKKNIQCQMLIGLGHDRIIYLGTSYIERGWITNDEYENLYDYLYKPYEAMGGNGSAKRIMEEVKKLPIRKSNYVLYSMEEDSYGAIKK